jgi:hypothetical protein
MSCGKQSHDARALNGLRQFSLVPSADAGAFGRKNLHVKIHETAQKASIFVINIFYTMGAKETFLFFFWLIIVHRI